MPSQPTEKSWQVEQPPVIPVWIMLAEGAGRRNPELPTTRVELAGTVAEGTLPAWHVSQVVPVGKCEEEPAGEVGGITIILVTP